MTTKPKTTPRLPDHSTSTNHASVARITRLVIVVGTVFVLVRLVVQAMVPRLGIPYLQRGLRAVSDVEVPGVGLWWAAVAICLVGPRRTQRRVGRERDPTRQVVYVTRGLLDVPLGRAV